MSDTDADGARWPKEVTPISYGDLGKLGVGPGNQLYWDGKPVVTKRRLDFTFGEKMLAGLTALAIIFGGLGGFIQGISAANDLGCKWAWWVCRQ
jgi:hypothetical protein